MSRTTLLCNGASMSEPAEGNCVSLHYLDGQKCDYRLRIRIHSILQRLNYLPDHVYDLLEIASYVYGADRLISRGERDQVEYHAWARRLHFVVRVRDHKFWSCPTVLGDLEALLSFLSGDDITFEFQPGHSTPPSHLFEFADAGGIADLDGANVLLFSGGLDSYTGALQTLQETDAVVCLVSHKSAQTTSVKSQVDLGKALERRFPGRVHRIPFECGLSGVRARDENQRTRMFLYSSIASAVAVATKAPSVRIFENGVTSLNLPRRQDLMNARATRTTHPKTVLLLSRFLGHMSGDCGRSVETPYRWMTKTDVLDILKQCGGADEFSSTVSCSKTYKTKEKRTHCGGCSQCVDRRFAAFAAGLGDEDECTPYSLDFLRDVLNDQYAEDRGTLIDYLAQAAEFIEATPDGFAYEHLAELSEVGEGCPELGEADLITQVWTLINRHGEQVKAGLQLMLQRDDPMRRRVPDTLFDFVAKQEHLLDPAFRLAERLSRLLSDGIKLAFQSGKPANERALNDQIEALLTGWNRDLKREFPAIPVGPKRLFPDHSVDAGLVIEGKYPRKPSRPAGPIVDEMLADVAGYGGHTYILFVVYDPSGLIHNERALREDIESKGRCRVLIIH